MVKIIRYGAKDKDKDSLIDYFPWETFILIAVFIIAFPSFLQAFYLVGQAMISPLSYLPLFFIGIVSLCLICAFIILGLNDFLRKEFKFIIRKKNG